ncbi:MAG: aminoglycoside phosphotransferase family protein [Planctomycetes bacterium]|nr:aminoglycoside phosphotransferase family protein [Planctomycetota bacterium]MCB9917985.1 aminoglycoside phosphotransferase family protein [Planctomycetota bacterium]
MADGEPPRSDHSVAPSELERVRRACATFAIPGHLVELHRFDRGHIHDTWVGTFETNGVRTRYLHQGLNGTVFPDIEAVMHNVETVTAWIADRPVVSGDHIMHTLELVPTIDGFSWFADERGRAWRTYRFIENTKSCDVCEGHDQAFEASRVFAAFQRSLRDLPVDRLETTIPHFFSSPYRLQQLQKAVKEDRVGRVVEIERELAFVDERSDLVPAIELLLRGGSMSPCVVHGDTKLNNILFDKDDGHAVAVVDLDTCMVGWSLFDFGDLVRFTAATSVEDEVDLAKAGTCVDYFAAIAGGWIEGSGGATDRERELMPLAARLVTLTLGMRFLADYVAGDVYFKCDPTRLAHNLERARCQFAMVADMEAKDDVLRAHCRQG